MGGTRQTPAFFHRHPARPSRAAILDGDACALLRPGLEDDGVVLPLLVCREPRLEGRPALEQRGD